MSIQDLTAGKSPAAVHTAGISHFLATIPAEFMVAVHAISNHQPVPQEAAVPFAVVAATVLLLIWSWLGKRRPKRTA